MVEPPKYCPIYLQKTLTGMMLFVVLFLAFWIRIQGVDRIPDEQFTGVDPYLYRWQALTVSDKGYLPARDMHRWYPLGRDNGQLLSLFSYAIWYMLWKIDIGIISHINGTTIRIGI